MACTFCQNERCVILLSTHCSEKCSFRKTKEEFFDGMSKSNEILIKKGLVPIIVKKDGKTIITTRRIDE